MKKSTQRYTKNQILHFLQDHPLGTISSINDVKIPESAVVYFFIQNDFSCYFVTKVDTRKYTNFLKRPETTLSVYDEEMRMSAEIQGIVKTETSGVKVAHIIEAFQELVASKSNTYHVPPIAQLDMGHYVVCRLIPTQVLFNAFAWDTTVADPVRLTFVP